MGPAKIETDPIDVRVLLRFVSAFWKWSGDLALCNLTEGPRGLIANMNLRQSIAGRFRSHPQALQSEDLRYAHSDGLFAKACSGLTDTQSMKGNSTRSGHTVSQSRLETHELRRVPMAFVETCKHWGLDTDAQLILLGYPPGDSIGKQVLWGRIQALSRDARDRADYVVAISVGLAILHGEDAAAEKRWLRRQRATLGGQSPLDRMLNGDMAALVVVNGMVERERGL